MYKGEEKYVEWLERLEVPETARKSISQLQKYLEEKLTQPLTVRQALALGRAIEKSEMLRRLGYQAVPVKTPWGKQVWWFRFGVRISWQQIVEELMYL